MGRRKGWGKPRMRRLCADIESKALKLYTIEPDSSTGQIMLMKDYDAIMKIMRRCLNRLK